MSQDMADEIYDTPVEVREDTPGRIVAAAGRCFYRDGIYATGVDALAAEAGISKRTLYNHFPSKDAVIAAYLRQREWEWQDKLSSLWEACGGDPVAEVTAYVRGYARPVTDEVFRGSAFINAAAELADDEHEALAVIRESVISMEHGVRDILAAADVPGAEDLARHILYLIEGAVAIGGARRDDDSLGYVEGYIRDLLEPLVR